MNINKEIKRKIILNKIAYSFKLMSLISIIFIFISALYFHSMTYMLLSALIAITSIVIGLLSENESDKMDYTISEILYFMSLSEKNKKQGIKLLVSKKSVEDLLYNMESIKKVTITNDWLIENINKKQIQKLLKNKSFVDYLKTIEYKKVKQYIEDQIKIMEFESKNGDYKYFINYLEEKKLIKIEEKIKILQI